jgi:hypothetical protein
MKKSRQWIPGRINFNLKRTAYAAVLIFFVFLTEKATSQDYQAWLDGFIIKPIGNSLENEVNIGAARLLEKDGWADYYICNTLTFTPFGWYMADGSVELHYSRDPQNQNLTEVRVFLGQKFSYPHFFEGIHLENPYMYMRLEQRFLHFIEDGTDEVRTRLRLRGGARFLLNNTTLSSGTYYIPVYYEAFINLNGEATERYASRTRIVAGFGYAFSYRWRAEFYYYGQRSRNTIEDSFVKSDVMFQLQLRYYLR